MACCRKIKINKKQMQIVTQINSATLSNRSPAGNVAKICPKCYTKSVFLKCKVCGFDFNSLG